MANKPGLNAGSVKRLPVVVVVFCLSAGSLLASRPALCVLLLLTISAADCREEEEEAEEEKEEDTWVTNNSIESRSKIRFVYFNVRGPASASQGVAFRRKVCTIILSYKVTLQYSNILRGGVKLNQKCEMHGRQGGVVVSQQESSRFETLTCSPSV